MQLHVDVAWLGFLGFQLWLNNITIVLLVILRILRFVFRSILSCPFPRSADWSLLSELPALSRSTTGSPLSRRPSFLGLPRGLFSFDRLLLPRSTSTTLHGFNSNFDNLIDGFYSLCFSQNSTIYSIRQYIIISNASSNIPYLKGYRIYYIILYIYDIH